MTDPFVHTRPGEILEEQERSRELRKQLDKLDGDGGFGGKLFAGLMILALVCTVLGIHLL